MTEIVSGTVVRRRIVAGKPEFDPAGTKQGVTVSLNDCDDGVAAVAIVSQYIHDLPAANRAGMLVDATKGLLRVADLKRTRVPSL